MLNPESKIYPTGKSPSVRLIMPSYQPSRLELIPIRSLRYCVRHWGKVGAPKVFLLHGWMDSSATFQFVVDALQKDWHLIAPDWRGYGQSEYLGRAYWFPDYYADLEALLDHYVPEETARLVGHSMGANIASIYAATRPQRIKQIAMLDFLGLNRSEAKEAPQQLGKWLDNLAGGHQLRTYADHDALCRRLQQSNPRLSAERAAFLSREVSRLRADGKVEMACDPWHKIPSPHLYKIEDVMAFWQRISCPVLMLNADAGFVFERFGTDSEEYRQRTGCFSQLRTEWIGPAGHNLQHDQPEQVAAVLESFLLEN